MTRLSLLVIALLITSTAFAQTDPDSLVWERTGIDENMSVDLPDVYVVTDTLGNHITQAQLYGGNVSVLVREFNINEASRIENVEHLQDFYSGAVEGILKALGGSELKSKGVEDANELLTQEFTFSVYGDNVKYLFQGWMMLANNNVYIVQVNHDALMTDEFDAVKQRVFSSIQVSDKIFPRDQLPQFMTSDNREQLEQGAKVGNILRAIILMLVAVFILLYSYLFYSARNGATTPAATLARKVFHPVRQVLIFLFLASGGLMFFAAIANWISANGFSIDIQFLFGVIAVAIAFGLSKLKTPTAKQL